MAKKGKFKFRQADIIGAADAEQDQNFLTECFIDTGDLEVLRSCDDPRRIVVGRTGVGKSALLIKLKEMEERVIEIKPESLSLAYISNSNILNFFTALGVRLDVFFKLLWRHVFTVEILKFHFKITTEKAKVNFLIKLKSLIHGKKHEKALRYLEDWGSSFWEETEYRIKEVTTKIEDDLKAVAKAKLPVVDFRLEGIRRLSQEQKQDIINRAQHVVNKVQIRQLSDIIDLIDEVLADPQKRYYLIVDRLDEDWIDEGLRYKLIRALIETAKDFGKVRYAKIVIAIRLDLLHRVFRSTRDAGFQEEKYESLYLDVQWRKADLIKMLDARINHLIKQRYTTKEVTHEDILPKRIRKSSTIDYIIDRTAMRPRDLILFFNCCILQALDSAIIKPKMILLAEREYSIMRFRSVGDEWYADYPNLLHVARLLKSRSPIFKVNTIQDREMEDFCLDFAVQREVKEDVLYNTAKEVANAVIEPCVFVRTMLKIFFHTGLIGLKVESFERTIWATHRIDKIVSGDIDGNTSVTIHPTYFSVLGIKVG
ncbi:MAG: hypothetical protein WBB67_00345 [bacterium]